ncbi:type I secretion system permease/ATPase [Porphyrobacter sp. AAP82]|uniref:type I secretion system permease/ATPase n=1 Tax=Porphyrobacter sp. AAP82 TaxID=1248917 RepID=UPI00030F93E4|nr:type I secretion system permease/ATPase [Porphyrobacter sp. AAP82]
MEPKSALLAEFRESNNYLKTSLKRSYSAIIAIFIISVIVNIFVLNGSIYMMMVYDRALPSQNLSTLFGLFGLSAIIYVAQGFFEVQRSAVLADIASSLEHSINPLAIRAAHELSIRNDPADRTGGPMRDLEQVRNFIAGPGPSAFMDLPWILFFLAILSMLHIWLGVAALVGACVLVALTVVTEQLHKKSASTISELGQKRQYLLDRKRRGAETIQALGMRQRFARMFLALNAQLNLRQAEVNKTLIVLSTISKTMRMFIQSALLAVGAWLVISGETSGGVIFASSILAGRALAPIDQAIAQWRNFSSARTSWARLNQTLLQFGVPETRVALNRPKGQLDVAELQIVPPGQETPTLHGVSFACEPGSIVGVIGASGAGKSSLARALVGIWPPSGGTIRLDGATLAQWDSDVLGSLIGYLPQTVELLEGTVAQNIARFDPSATSEGIIEAATHAGVHELILQLPDGYETEVGEEGRRLSAGQRQRVGLARALYQKPSLVVLDEPNSNLDPAGEQALAAALINLRKNHSTAVVVTHRQAMLRFATHILYLADGKVVAFGPRDAVLQAIKDRSNVQTMPEAEAARV